MSDINPKPIAVSPSGVAPITSITAAAAPPTTASAAEIPAAIANLSVGTVLTGTVIERGPALGGLAGSFEQHGPHLPLDTDNDLLVIGEGYTADQMPKPQRNTGVAAVSSPSR